MSRHKAYALSPRDCLKTTLFQKWQRTFAPPGKRGRRTVALHEKHQPVEPNGRPVYRRIRFSIVQRRGEYSSSTSVAASRASVPIAFYDQKLLSPSTGILLYQPLSLPNRDPLGNRPVCSSRTVSASEEKIRKCSRTKASRFLLSPRVNGVDFTVNACPLSSSCCVRFGRVRGTN